MGGRLSKRVRELLGDQSGFEDSQLPEEELFEQDGDEETEQLDEEQTGVQAGEPAGPLTETVDVGDDASALAASDGDGNTRVDGTAKVEDAAPVSKGEEKIAKMLERLRAKGAELEERLKAKQEKRASKPAAAGGASKPAAEATSVPGMFPRQPSVGRIWAIVQEKVSDGKVELSINAITKQLATNRSTVKGAFKALQGAGILVDTTPTLNAAHTYEVHDPFAGKASTTDAEQPAVEQGELVEA